MPAVLFPATFFVPFVLRVISGNFLCILPLSSLYRHQSPHSRDTHPSYLLWSLSASFLLVSISLSAFTETPQPFPPALNTSPSCPFYVRLLQL